MTTNATIRDVASQAGVSATTVSNFLAGRSERMLPETRARIETAISELNYRPNRAARALRTGRAHSIGLIVPSVANPFWGSFASELERGAIAAGHTVLLGNAERDPDRELRYVEDLWDAGIRSVVLGTSLPSLAHLEPIIARGLRLVTFDRPAQPNDPSSVISVSVDNHVGGLMAASHLINLGHRDLAFVASSLHSLNRAARFRGFCAALESADIDPASVRTQAESKVTHATGVEAATIGRSAIRNILNSGDSPTAVVAINDMTALGVCWGIRDAGLEVGVDISVVGFDDIVLAPLNNPPLTTVRQPLPELAQVTLRAALDESNNDVPQGRSILLRPELVVRDSTRALVAPEPG